MTALIATARYRVAGPDGHDVVGIVGDRRSNRSRFETKTSHKRDRWLGRFVAIDNHQFQQIARWIGNGESIDDLRPIPLPNE